MLDRKADITPIGESKIQIFIDDIPVKAAKGETVLSAMYAVQKNAIMQNDHNAILGAYCGMGICHSCLVKINGKYKQRSCKTLISDGMQINTLSNRFNDIGIPVDLISEHAIPIITSADFEKQPETHAEDPDEVSNVN